ncbi:hypothetical protein HDU76_003060 [Blyttiomyces sp. JEL0837]|nr:hypothetical protein HDU76_003060 [Blyttiomyces sp. JEL0837]
MDFVAHPHNPIPPIFFAPDGQAYLFPHPSSYGPPPPPLPPLPPYFGEPSYPSIPPLSLFALPPPVGLGPFRSAPPVPRTAINNLGSNNNVLPNISNRPTPSLVDRTTDNSVDSQPASPIQKRARDQQTPPLRAKRRQGESKHNATPDKQQRLGHRVTAFSASEQTIPESDNQPTAPPTPILLGRGLTIVPGAQSERPLPAGAVIARSSGKECVPTGPAVQRFRSVLNKVLNRSSQRRKVVRNLLQGGVADDIISGGVSSAVELLNVILPSADDPISGESLKAVLNLCRSSIRFGGEGNKKKGGVDGSLRASKTTITNFDAKEVPLVIASSGNHGSSSSLQFAESSLVPASIEEIDSPDLPTLEDIQLSDYSPCMFSLSDFTTTANASHIHTSNLHEHLLDAMDEEPGRFTEMSVPSKIMEYSQASRRRVFTYPPTFLKAE